jgi:uncharacterized membrane protein
MRGGFLIGLGVGGFVDGIALHQIAHWHNMGSAVLPPTTMDAMRRNMAWDGWFHAACLVLVLAGVYALAADARGRRRVPTARALTGHLLLGGGTFNLVEGIVDHHVLQLHHVRDLPVHVPLYDWLFLVVGGIGYLLLGWALARRPDDRARGVR